MIEVDLKRFVQCQFLSFFSKLSQHKINISLFSFLGKWTVPNDFLAKKKQIFFYEGLRPIAASIKEGLSSTKIDHCVREG